MSLREGGPKNPDAGLQRGDLVDIVASPTEVGIVTCVYERIAYVRRAEVQRMAGGLIRFTMIGLPLPYDHGELKLLERDFNFANPN